MSSRPAAPAQGGIALVTAILVVAIATIAATAVLSSSQVALHRATSLRDGEQAWWYAQSVEAWVLRILRDDAQKNQHDCFDPREELWSVPVPALPVEDRGMACGLVEDLQGRFNLNNLDPRLPPNLPYRAQFERLLALVVPAGVTVPPGLADAIQDWMDDDQVPRPAGAEDSYYLGLSPPYLTGGRPFTSVTELMAVKDVTKELYVALMTGCPDDLGAPGACITALPHGPVATSGSLVNVNTASAVVLTALSQSPPKNLDKFLQERREQCAKDVNAFIQAGYLDASVNASVIGVRTEHFQLRGNLFVGTGHVALYSSIHRPSNGAPVVRHRSTVSDLPGSPPCAIASTSP